MPRKDYSKWMPIKAKLNNAHLSSTKAHHTRIHKGEVYWIYFGENIGHEQDGKSKLFTRPGIVIKTYGQSLITVLPLTTNKKNDIFHYSFNLGKTISTASLSQIRSIDSARVGTKIGKADNITLAILKSKLMALLS